MATLHKWARNGQVEAVRALCAAQADVDVLDASGWAPLHYFSYHPTKGPLVARALLEFRADLSARTGRGRSCLDVLPGNVEVAHVHALCELGFELDLRDARGKTALHHFTR